MTKKTIQIATIFLYAIKFAITGDERYLKL